jgi:two-component system response regulator HydG
MPLTLQSKLLRALETGIVEPLGGTSPIKIDVRIISATNQDLLKLINSGKFRHDLYYRLRVFLLEIPPLREHPDDIPLFISYFLKQISAKLGKDLSGISPKVLKTLKSYEWPGNVRQLRNALEEMAILSQNDIIDILPSFIDESIIRPKISGKTMDNIEHEAIVQALGKTDGNRTKAAKLLGIGLRTLYRKIDKYGIE